MTARVLAVLALVGLGAALSACQTAAPGAETAARVPPLAISTPLDLMGKDAQELQAVLGTPALLRKEEPAQVWQYRGRACVLDFYLYDEGGRHGVTHVEARGRSGGSARLEDCLQDVHRARYTTRAAAL